MATSLLEPAALPEAAPWEQQVWNRTTVQPRSRPRTQRRVRHHVLGESLFRDALVRERQRADRYGSRFAVLTLDRRECSSQDDDWTEILGAVTDTKRDYDLVGWLRRPQVLGLLLTEASDTGALEAMSRLCRALGERLGDGPQAAPSIRLYVHGDHADLDGALPSVDMLVDSLGPGSRQLMSDAAKRGLDIVGSVLLLALFAPLLLAIFALVKWTSAGPVFFKQVRVGRRGQPFTMLKFRTMHVNAGDAIHRDYVTWFIKSSGQQPRTGDQVFKLTNDPRITRVGHLLRKTSLDELPQFWNVLRGDMSLVGPRPPLPFEVEQYRSWHRRRVHDAKPGITGPWQVNGRSRTTFDDMVRLDLRYARTHSLWTDIKLLAATPRAMISGKGAC